MSGMDWYARNPRKALRGKEGLTLEERGAYDTLLDLIYLRGEAFPDDDRKLAGEMNVSVRRWKLIRQALLDKGRIVLRQTPRGPALSDELAEIELENQAARRRTNSENGTKGGEKSAEKRAETRKNNDLGEATGQPPGQARLKLETETGIEEIPPLPPKGGGDLFDLEAEPDPEPVDEVRVAFDQWNETAKLCGLPIAKDLTDRRARAIKARLKDGGATGWLEALVAVEVSAWCRGLRTGGDGQAFKADIDFVCQPKSFQRLREGFYRADAPAPRRVADPPVVIEDPWVKRVREFVQNGRWNRVDWGPKPGAEGCEAPPAVLTQFGLTQADNLVTFPAERAAG